MERFDAIYTRQSVERQESISVESQVEFCKKEGVGTQIRIYTDKGYSGKTIDRPAFQEMMQDIEAGKVRRVIVYRLDRISRSVLDFANVIDIFQRNHVDFVSTMEKFDTGTPIGKAMLMIVMIFAQLERETIQQRIMDAYASRSKRGFYMGGKVPFGFRLKETVLDGVCTKMYEPIPEETEIVQIIFRLYAEPQTSLGDTARYLLQNGLLNREEKPFTRYRIRDMIVNPVYVRADYQIYEFFKAHGVNLVNPPADFIGRNAAYLYSGEEKKKRKTISLSGHTLVLAPHEGMIDAETWLKCRRKCLKNQRVAKPIKAKATWLVGKLKCGYCGYALNAKTYPCKTKEDNRYFICSHKYASPGSCQFRSLDADVVEKIIFDEMKKKLLEFQTLVERKEETYSIHEIEMKLRTEEIEKEIASLLDMLVTANETVGGYIKERIMALDAEKKAFYAKMQQIRESRRKKNADEISDYMECWQTLSIGDKITVVDCLIERIEATEEKMEIIWKI